MLKIHCPITGHTINLQSFTNSSTKIYSAHPILYASPQQLAEMTPENDSEYQLLFLSILHKFTECDLLQYDARPANLSARWIKQEYPYMQSFMLWALANKSNPRLEALPQIRITRDISEQNIQAWRVTCQEEFSRWDTYHDASVKRIIRAEREAALELLNLNVNPNATTNPKLARAHSRKIYLYNALTPKLSPIMVDFYCKLVASAHTYEVMQLKDAKEYFLDELPDTRIEDYNDKQEILYILDAAIFDKMGLAAMLGVKPTQKEVEILSNLRSSLSVNMDGSTFITTSSSKVRNAIAFSDSAALPVEIPMYESEPQRADFKSELGYKIALKQWEKQNASK